MLFLISSERERAGAAEEGRAGRQGEGGEGEGKVVRGTAGGGGHEVEEEAD